ncbi:hypothetical protein DFO48_105568 [Comamonas sp. AG1104]|nr:hypothetical protein DFO48_105568 [Comamonas sp. AG1104]
MHSTPTSEAPVTRTTRAVLRPAVSPSRKRFITNAGRTRLVDDGVSSRVGPAPYL